MGNWPKSGSWHYSPALRGLTLPRFRQELGRLGRIASVGGPAGSSVKPPHELRLWRMGIGPVMAGSSQRGVQVGRRKAVIQRDPDKKISSEWSTAAHGRLLPDAVRVLVEWLTTTLSGSGPTRKQPMGLAIPPAEKSKPFRDNMSFILKSSFGCRHRWHCCRLIRFQDSRCQAAAQDLRWHWQPYVVE